MWRRLKWRLIPIALGAALGCLILWDNAAHAATGDTGVFVPTVRTPIPDFTVTTGQPLHVNGYFYIPCTTYMGSTVPYPANFTVSPSVPGMGAINPLTGQWDGTPTSSVANVTIRCDTPMGSASDTLNVTVQAGQTQLLATGKFVDCSAGTNGTGTSASPWNKISSIAGLATAEDLWFKAGTTCNSTYTTSVSGTANDHAIIGTYYLSGGTAYQLWPDNPTAASWQYTWSHGSRAIIRGTYDETCSKSLGASAAGWCAMNGHPGSTQTGGGVPGGTYSPLVGLDCSYCDVQSLAVKYSAGRGIGIGITPNLNQTTFQRSDHRIINNEVGPSATHVLGIQNTHNDVFYGNTLHDYGLSSSRGGADKIWFPMPKTTGSVQQGADGPPYWGTFASNNVAAISTGVFSNINTLIEKNDFYNGWQEGLIISQVGHLIFRGNRVQGGNTHVGLYTQSCLNCVYEYNLIYGGTVGDHADDNGYGIGIVAESFFDYDYGTDIIIRGNMVTRTGNCLRFNPEDVVGWTGSVKFYNNTCIDIVSGLAVGEQSGFGVAQVGANGIHIKNNIFYNQQPSLYTGTCTSGSRGSAIGIQWDYNNWYPSVPSNTNCRGPNDKNVNPLMTTANISSKTRWTPPLPTPADFTLQAGSPVLGVGTPLTATVLTVNSTEFPIRSEITYPCATFDTKGFVIDSVCRAVDVTPDLGAQGR